MPAPAALAAAEPAAAAPVQVLSAQYPANLQFGSVTAGPEGLQLSGTATIAGDTGVDCLTAQVDPMTLVLSHIVEPRCDDPRTSGEPFMEVSQPRPGGLSDDLRIAGLAPATGDIALGPVIASYEDASDTHLESVVGGGSLWLYLAAPLGLPNNSEAIEVSEATGQVLGRALLPWVLTRPVIAADDEGLFISPSIESGLSRAGTKSGVTIFRVAPGAKTAQPFYRAGGVGQGVVANWMVGDGSSLWAEVCRRPASTDVCHILRFDGLGPGPAMTSPEISETDDWAVGNVTVGLFSSLWPPSSAAGAPPPATTIVRVDPSDGAETKVASVMLPAYWGFLSYDGNPGAAIYDGALYLLGQLGQTNATTLYRVPISGTP